MNNLRETFAVLGLVTIGCLTINNISQSLSGKTPFDDTSDRIKRSANIVKQAAEEVQREDRIRQAARDAHRVTTEKLN
jgi:hypothetical protein